MNPAQNQNAAQTLSEVCLRYPDSLGTYPTITYETAVNLLQRAVQLAMQAPFIWTYIDRPPDGCTFLVFMVQQQVIFPNDGIKYQESEQRYALPAGPGKELEVCEIKYGFIPDQDTNASRVRRRYRLLKGGHPQLVLVHYSRGHSMPISQALMSQPGRTYPLRPINEPGTFVLGDRMGQKVYTDGSRPPSNSTASGANMNMMAMPMNQQAMLAQQNREMAAFDRRQQHRERMPGANQRIEDDDSGDELDQVSTQALALSRYKRNHEFMNEIFMHAALRGKSNLESPYSCFDLADIQKKSELLNSQIDQMKTKASANNEKMSTRGNILDDSDMNAVDITMDSVVAVGIAS